MMWQKLVANSKLALARMLLGQGGYDGDESLSWHKALTNPAIWYGINKIAGHVGQMPVCAYRKLERGSEKLMQHNVSKLLAAPTPLTTACGFKQTLVANAIIDGNGLAAIIKQQGRPVELVMLHPQHTISGIVEGRKQHYTKPPKDDRLRLFFDSDDPDDKEGLISLSDDQVIHLPGLSYDGSFGIALRDIGKRDILSSIAVDDRIASAAKKGFAGALFFLAPHGVLQRKEDADEFLEMVDKRHSGSDNANRPGLLRSGMDAKLIEANSSDMELSEHRKFQRQNAALLLGLESILGDDSSVSYNSEVEKKLAYLTNTLNRWLVPLEQEIERKLFSVRERMSNMYYVKFQTSALLKSDHASTMDYLSVAVRSMLMTINEAREKLDMNPIEGGDVLVNPATSSEPREESQDDENEQEESEDSNPQESEANATLDRLQHLMRVEKSRLRNAAEQASEKGTNYIDWLERFYNKWQVTLSKACEQLDIDSSLAEHHCKQNKDRILDACDTATQETLSETIVQITENWEELAKGFV